MEISTVHCENSRLKVVIHNPHLTLILVYLFAISMQSLVTVLLHLLHPDQAEGVADPGAGHGPHLRPLQRARVKLEDGVLVP